MSIMILILDASDAHHSQLRARKAVALRNTLHMLTLSPARAGRGRRNRSLTGTAAAATSRTESGGGRAPAARSAWIYPRPLRRGSSCCYEVAQQRARTQPRRGAVGAAAISSSLNLNPPLLQPWQLLTHPGGAAARSHTAVLGM